MGMSTKSLWVWTGVVALGALAFVGCGAQTQVQFRPNVGDSRAIQVVIDTTSSVNMMGN